MPKSDTDAVRADLKRLAAAAPGMQVATADAVRQGDVVLYQLGRRDMLTDLHACESGEVFKNMLRKNPCLREVIFVMPGFDDDLREIWDIPEAAEYVRQFAQAAGISDALDLIDVIGEAGVGFLAACGVPAPGVTIKREQAN
jgi:hypothetical protein